MRDTVPHRRGIRRGIRRGLRRTFATGAAGLVVAGLSWGAPAQAATPGREAAAQEAPLLDSGSAAGRKFRSTGRLVGGDGTTCTATVIHSSARPDPAQKALILSNGHCVSDVMKTNEVVADRAAPEGWTFTPAYFHDNTAEQRTFSVDRVVYATMKGIDVSVLRISATYGDLAKLGVTPRTPAAHRPAQGTRLQAAHAPADGVEEGKRFLRLSECAATGTGVALHEYTWLWRDFVRTDCRGISGGSSGGAVTTVDGTELVGMLNTVSTPGYFGCGLGRPCEGGASGLVVPPDDTVYVTPVDAVASCLDGAGLQLDRPGCRLDRGEQVEVTSSGQQTQNTTPQGPARWDAHVTPLDGRRHAYVAFKTGPFGATDCTRREGYSRPQDLPAKGLNYSELLPGRDNLYVLCAVGGPDATAQGAAWARSFAHPSYAYARVDNTPPTVAPEVNVQRFDDEPDGTVYWVRPVYAPFEITSYRIKYGPKAATHCADPDGYHYFLGIPASLKASEGPWTYCAIGYDNADNPTPPKTVDIP
ncbi:trypsin-like peptidase domain-containing protein [Streptomyces sp. NPDC001404]|uniref:trypsin-like peptidase domain-containing protein n=1 Tax=Streptomyces sp. NPDC001404 TaxID=3364571 RepID=UPI003681218D